MCPGISCCNTEQLTSSHDAGVSLRLRRGAHRLLRAGVVVSLRLAIQDSQTAYRVSVDGTGISYCPELTRATAQRAECQLEALHFSSPLSRAMGYCNGRWSQLPKIHPSSLATNLPKWRVSRSQLAPR